MLAPRGTKFNRRIQPVENNLLPGIPPEVGDKGGDSRKKSKREAIERERQRARFHLERCGIIERLATGQNERVFQHMQSSLYLQCPGLMYACDADGNSILHHAVMAGDQVMLDELLLSSNAEHSMLWLPYNCNNECILTCLANEVERATFPAKWRPVIKIVFDGIQLAMKKGRLVSTVTHFHLDTNLKNFRSYTCTFARHFPDLLFVFLEAVFVLESPDSHNPWKTLPTELVKACERLLRSKSSEWFPDHKSDIFLRLLGNSSLISRASTWRLCDRTEQLASKRTAVGRPYCRKAGC